MSTSRSGAQHFQLQQHDGTEQHSWISPKIELRPAAAGNGVFTKEAISKGERVVDFSTGPGEYVHGAEAERLFDEGNDYMIQVDEDLFFAATSSGSLEIADFINHSCDPNCGIRGALEIVALRDIAPGEEIAFDYAMSESSDYTMQCQCGSSLCRSVITGQDWRRPDLQRRYSGYFSDYLQRRIDQQNSSS